MIYEWNENKRALNIRNHGVDFPLINDFDWASCLTKTYERNGETRYTTLAPIKGRLYVLVYTVRKTNIRLISLRKANKREVRNYVKKR